MSQVIEKNCRNLSKDTPNNRSMPIKSKTNNMSDKYTKTISRAVLAAILSGACAMQTHAEAVGGRKDFRDETIYFVMTSRFFDGDSTNNAQCPVNAPYNVGDPGWRGDFKGLIDKLDYIKALGFTAVWITPVAENHSACDYHGYHAIDYSKVDKRLESPGATFDNLVAEAHRRGMKIVLDIVLNHTCNNGERNLMDLPDSMPVAERLAALRGTADSLNYWHHVEHFAWNDDSRWWGSIADDCVDLNTENPAVTEYLIRCYERYIKAGVDGFRIDTSGHISRYTFNDAFLPRFSQLAADNVGARNGGDFIMFGEVCNRSRDITPDGQDRLASYFYTWKEDKPHQWTTDTLSWRGIAVPADSHGDHINARAVDCHAADYSSDGSETRRSDNAFLHGNKYHTPDRSQFSGLNVIDFPMHCRFSTADEAWTVREGDDRYNDATWNVVYVDSHDAAPEGAPADRRFMGDTDTWMRNLNLMFTFRGIPCLYYGSEIEFKKGCLIDPGFYAPLENSGRAYFGDAIEGTVTVSDFGEVVSADGAVAGTLNHPLARHIRRLNKIRAAVPALRRGQYSTQGCVGAIAFKRRYTDDVTDSYALITVGGDATFTDIENGNYVEMITGKKVKVKNNSLRVKCPSPTDLRVYVLDTPQTPAVRPLLED